MFWAEQIPLFEHLAYTSAWDTSGIVIFYVVHFFGTRLQNQDGRVLTSCYKSIEL